MRKIIVTMLLTLLMIGMVQFQVQAWESLDYPGGTPRHMYVQTPGEMLIVGSYWTGFYRLNLSDETWFLPEYGPECLNGGIMSKRIDSPYYGSDTLLAASTNFSSSIQDPPYIVRSIDGGLTWQRSDDGLPEPIGRASSTVAFDPFHPDTALWGGGQGFVCRSIDGGVTWSQLEPAFGAQAHVLNWSSQIEGLALLGTGVRSDTTSISGILRSIDHGETWEQVWPDNPPPPSRTMNLHQIIEDPFDSAHWFAAVSDYYSPAEENGDCIWVSTDTGRTWQLSMEGMEDVYTVWDIIADPSIPGRFWVTAPQVGVYRSDDGGMSWMLDTEGLGQWNLYAYLAVDPSTSEVFVSQYNGRTYRKPSLDTPWQPVAENPFDTPSPHLRIVQSQIITQGSLGIFASPPPPNWNLQQLDENLSINDHLSIAFEESDFNRRAIFTIHDWRNYQYRVHVTQDAGQIWDEWCPDIPLPDYPEFVEFVHPDTLLIAATNGSIQLVWENGTSIVAGPNLGYLSAFLHKNNDCLFTINGAIYWSDDRGVTLHLSQGPANMESVYFLAGDISGGGLLIGTGFHEDIYYSTDAGHNWHNMQSPTVGNLGDITSGGGFVYVVSYNDGLVYAREGLEDPWFALDEGHQEGFEPLQIQADEDGIVATGTVARPGLSRLYYHPRPITGVASSWEALPINYSLDAPYPNPFNAELTVPFTLPREANVEITITNLMGQNVATLADQYFLSGRHTLHWDASEFASGTYIVNMRTPEGKSMARKIQLVK